MKTLSLPQNLDRQKLLRIKMAQYRERLSDHRETVRFDAICKIAIIENLLAHGQVTRKSIWDLLSGRDDSRDLLSKLDAAWQVVVDYCLTGGRNTIQASGQHVQFH